MASELESQWKKIFALPPSQMKIELKKIDFAQVTPSNQNILHIACIESNKDAINMILDVDLINGRLNIDLKDNLKTWSPLYYVIDSCDNGQPDICEILIKSNANVNICDKFGVSPLHLAAYKGQDDNVEYFLKQKANIDAKDKLGRTPLMYAIIEGQTNCVQFLLENGSDLNSVDINGDSLIHYAAKCKGNSLLYSTMLINKGIDVNKINNEGNTALMCIAMRTPKENVRLIHTLLKQGTDINVVNQDGDTFYSILGKEAIKTGEIKSNIDITKQNVAKSSLSMTSIVFFFVLPVVIAYIAKMIKNK